MPCVPRALIGTRCWAVCDDFLVMERPYALCIFFCQPNQSKIVWLVCELRTLCFSISGRKQLPFLSKSGAFVSEKYFRGTSKSRAPSGTLLKNFRVVDVLHLLPPLHE